MGTFKTIKNIKGDQNLIPVIADRITSSFKAEGFTVEQNNYGCNIYDISLAKGGVFKAVLGMISALKIALRPDGDGIYFEAGVGIFGQQAIPTAITLFAFWPVMIPQIWGMVQQSKLDDKALAIAESVVAEQQAMRDVSGVKSPGAFVNASFCPQCGSPVGEGAKFCSNCGAKIE